ncbi:hypothetical protein M752DRAFT_279150 [Aspergillus phoenicis ATCC 13157]|uniref:Tat pathway signal sequence n=1 Tax=Aspergillus phoenicis ATCC 13157 TaxID=1353007 RepID=A0A370P7K4_ASPPH|nr:hypothetical protein M752DRAFT_279150 [Aspergillus phoenicis ATCC 13157]
MDSEQTSSESPFLPKKMLRDSFESEHPPRPFQNVSWFQRNQKCLLSNVVVIAVCVTLGAMYHHSYLGRLQCAPQSLIYTPARNSLEYVKVRMDTAGGHQSKYLGFGDEADEAWTDLTSRNHVRLSEEDLLAINQTSIPLGSGGYLGMLGVYHELHCVKWIRWALNQSKYQDSLSDHDIIDLPAHISHCVDIVRQSVMCRANTAIVTYSWIKESRVPKTDFHAYSQCVDWDKFEAWADKHTVDILGPGELNHPIYGQTFPNRHRLEEDGKIPAILPALEYGT